MADFRGFAWRELLELFSESACPKANHWSEMRLSIERFVCRIARMYLRNHGGKRRAAIGVRRGPGARSREVVQEAVAHPSDLDSSVASGSRFFAGDHPRTRFDTAAKPVEVSRTFRSFRLAGMACSGARSVLRSAVTQSATSALSGVDLGGRVPKRAPHRRASRAGSATRYSARNDVYRGYSNPTFFFIESQFLLTGLPFRVSNAYIQYGYISIG